jgi:hypothetical protein
MQPGVFHVERAQRSVAAQRMADEQAMQESIRAERGW